MTRSPIGLDPVTRSMMTPRCDLIKSFKNILVKSGYKTTIEVVLIYKRLAQATSNFSNNKSMLSNRIGYVDWFQPCKVLLSVNLCLRGITLMKDNTNVGVKQNDDVGKASSSEVATSGMLLQIF